MRPPCRTAFFYPVLTFAGFGIPALASLRASQVCQTLLISSYISRCCPYWRCQRGGVDDAARHLPGKGCSAARMGVGLLGQIDLASRRCSAARMGWDVPSNTSLLCQIGSSGVLLKSTRGKFLVIPSPPLGAYSAALGWLCRQGPVASLPFAVLTLTAPAFAAPLRCEGGSGGMTTAGDLFKFKTILFL